MKTHVPANLEKSEELETQGLTCEAAVSKRT